MTKDQILFIMTFIIIRIATGVFNNESLDEFILKLLIGLSLATFFIFYINILLT